MEEEMEQSVDITTKVVGMYNGDSKFSESVIFFLQKMIESQLLKKGQLLQLSSKYLHCLSSQNIFIP